MNSSDGTIAADLDGAIGKELGSDVVEAAAVSGGDTAAAFRILLADGRTIFAKTAVSPPPGFFGRESIDLGWLAEARTLPVPTVLAVRDDTPPFLALSWVEHGASRPSTEVTFGVGLADLHRSGADCFGRTDGRTTGSLALPNEPTRTWAEFYSTCRLIPLALIARDRRSLSRRTTDRIEQVAMRLDELGGPVEPAARLHGDLWAGNRLVDSHGESWLIDPACHGGHREFDLAMMRLFGGFGAESFDAYHGAFPLADGWQARVPLHQLAPLIVHAIKFGGHYVAAVDGALDAVLSDR